MKSLLPQEPALSGLHRVLFFLVLVIATALILPQVIRHGMFMDGMIYATVAKNLANHSGSLWDLRLSHCMLDHYRHQPPLTIWITAVFFKLLGNSIYTERIYSFLTAIIAMFCIRSVWKAHYLDREEKNTGWLPALFFIVTPVVFWAFRNNMEENTMVLFILGSVYFNTLCLVQKKNCTLNSILAGLLIFLATLCKGVQGTFAIIYPLIYGLLFHPENFIKYVRYFLLSLTVLLTGAFALYVYPPSGSYFRDYFNQRLVRTFADPATANNPDHFYLLYRLPAELLVMGGLFFLFLLILRFKFHKVLHITGTGRKDFYLFLLTGLAGTLPLLVTREQRGFYLIPALPFYAMAIASLIAKDVTLIVKRFIPYKKVIGITVLILLQCVIGITLFNKSAYSRDELLIRSVHTVHRIMGDEKKLKVSTDQEYNWSLHLYFKRLHDIDIYPNDTSKINTPFYLVSGTDQYFNPAGYSLVNDDLSGFRLFKKTP